MSSRIIEWTHFNVHKFENKFHQTAEDWQIKSQIFYEKGLII